MMTFVKNSKKNYVIDNLPSCFVGYMWNIYGLLLTNTREKISLWHY